MATEFGSGHVFTCMIASNLQFALDTGMLPEPQGPMNLQELRTHFRQHAHTCPECAEFGATILARLQS